MESKAVVCRGTGGLPGVERIVIEPPRRDEVLIKLSACGVCHSDQSVVDGTIPMPRPIVLGHEGAGTIIETGAGVTEFAVGDAVVSSFVSVCGHCGYCRRGRHSLCDHPNMRPCMSTVECDSDLRSGRCREDRGRRHLTHEA